MSGRRTLGAAVVTVALTIGMVIPTAALATHEKLLTPTGKDHVFCFAYYVSPAPTAGTIKIVKTVEPDSVPAQDFPFHGDVSYAQSGAFTVNASGKKDGSISFIR